ncbi:hypothetical protein, partial [Escherichia coli]|uniref:hypothetical protein n=1 Tax=Escherichia coli TaxID=562 RepID=UPI002449258D
VQPDSSAAAIVIQSSGCFFMLLISSQGKKKDSHRHVNGKRTAPTVWSESDELDIGANPCLFCIHHLAHQQSDTLPGVMIQYR